MTCPQFVYKQAMFQFLLFFKIYAQDFFEMRKCPISRPVSKSAIIVVTSVTPTPTVVPPITLTQTSTAAEPVSTCVQRKEWRELSSVEQQNYQDAVVCLKQKPSKMNINSPSRYDDIAYAHFRSATTKHNSAQFLVWHRWFLHSFEKILQSECGFTGALPYWDWTVDVNNAESSEVLNDFGGDGHPVTGCLQNAPFANWATSFQPSPCLTRRYLSSPGFNGRSGSFQPTAINSIIATRWNYASLSNSIELGPHAAAHLAMSGTMSFLTMAANGFFS